MVFLAAYYLEAFLSMAAATTAGSDTNGRGVAVVLGVHVGMVFAATILRTSMVRSATRH